LRPKHHPAGVQAEVVSTSTPGQQHHNAIPNFRISNTMAVCHEYNTDTTKSAEPSDSTSWMPGLQAPVMTSSESTSEVG
jgi:hypothetical protein